LKIKKLCHIWGDDALMHRYADAIHNMVAVSFDDELQTRGCGAGQQLPEPRLAPRMEVALRCFQ
jgi:hypothetical protein